MFGTTMILLVTILVLTSVKNKVLAFVETASKAMVLKTLIIERVVMMEIMLVVMAVHQLAKLRLDGYAPGQQIMEIVLVSLNVAMVLLMKIIWMLMERM
jgi:hypothetical protein